MFKLVKYLIVLLLLILLAFAIPPALLAMQFYEEDRKKYKKRRDHFKCCGTKYRNQFMIFTRDVVRVFTIIEGTLVGFVSDLLFTPVFLVLETVGIFVGIPLMIYLEREERNKIRR